MAEPVRKMPADLETGEPPEADPFRYGWRPRYVRLPDGGVSEEEIPLTAEDLLDPQDGDVVGQSEHHFSLLLLLAVLLRSSPGSGRRSSASDADPGDPRIRHARRTAPAYRPPDGLRLSKNPTAF